MKIENPSQEILAGYRHISDEQKFFINELSDRANHLLDLINQLPNSRRKSISITKLEECVLFANKCACCGE